MRQQLNVVFVCQRIEVKPILPPKLIFYIIDIIGTTTITIEELILHDNDKQKGALIKHLSTTHQHFCAVEMSFAACPFHRQG